MEQHEINYRSDHYTTLSTRTHEFNAPFVSSLTPEQVGLASWKPIHHDAQVASWGIIKMNDYLVSGTRQQYWEEFFVKHVMSVRLIPS